LREVVKRLQSARVRATRNESHKQWQHVSCACEASRVREGRTIIPTAFVEPRHAGHGKRTLLDLPRKVPSLLRYWWTQGMFPGRVVCHGCDSRGARIWFWVGLLLLLGLAGPLLLVNLDYPLVEQDEGRYAEIGREMLASGDWIVPTLNHEPYFDKPPLFYWLVAGSFWLFGLSAGAARLVPALAALCTIVAVYGLGQRLVGRRAAFLGGLALTVMAGFIQCGRILIIDSLLTLFVTLAFLTAHGAVQRPRLRWRWWLLSGLCCGLGVLTKGPVALVLLGPVLVAYVWLQRDQARLGLFAWLVYGGLIALVAAPWFIAICVRQPEFAGQFIIEHHFKRFTAAGYHESPAWFYVPVLLVGTLPWSLLLVPFCQFLLSRSPAVTRLRPAGMGFLLLWAAWCFVFFSLSRGKLPPYVLPLLPAVALMMGCYLDRVLGAGLAQPYFWSRTAVPRLGIGMLAGIWLTASVVLYLMRLTSEPVMVASVVISTVCLVGTAVYGRRPSPHAAWALFGAVGLLVTWTGAHLVTPAWANRNAPLGQSAEATRLLQDGSIPVACFNREWGSIPFYVGHDNVRNFSGPASEDLAQFLLAQRRVVIVVRHDELDQALCRVPAGMTVRVLEAGVARVALVEAMPAPLK
jgi:dolichol-phosphate mannosyltransferase